MPLDGVSRVLSAQDILESALSAGGRKPIDHRFLDRHKAGQIRRCSAGWASRHRRVVELAQVAALVAGAVSFLVLFSADRPAWGAAAGLPAIGLGILPLLVPTRGPAQWRERIADDLHGAPPAIRGSAAIAAPAPRNQVCRR